MTCLARHRLLGVLLVGTVLAVCAGVSHGAESLVIAASPSLSAPLRALGQAFERSHPDVKVQLHFASGLELRQMIATMQNRHGNKYFIGSGPIHLIAPGGDEVITRLETRNYVLPESRTSYATASLVLVVPESLVEAPGSFEALAKDVKLRIAVADPSLTVLGKKTEALLRALGGMEPWNGRLDIATDAKAALDHLMNGQADAAIIFGPDAVREADRVRVAAVAPAHLDQPVTYSMAAERFCPNRMLCSDFLTFARSREAETILKGLGYGVPVGRTDEPVSVPFAKK
jgi:molybdate transport system substrate-binding protein